MPIDRVREYLKRWGKDADVRELPEKTATVAEAAGALGVSPARIAKSLSIRIKDRVLVLVTAGDMRVDNLKFKGCFGRRPRMLAADEVLEITGYKVGGVCPFGLPEDVPVYLDNSLRRFKTVFPACGTDNSLIEVTPEELHEYARNTGWVDVCHPYE
ncbi:MAG: YbaK/EbsC family protein [Christensenellaceae bacterium]